MEDFNEKIISSRALQRFLEVPLCLGSEIFELAETKPNKTTEDFLIPSKEDWTDEMNRDFLEFAEDEMKHWGYL